MSTSDFLSFRSAVFVTSSLQALNLILRFALSLFLARALGVQGRGELALALILPMLFHTILYFGMGEANTYLLGKRRFDPKAIVGCLNSLDVLMVLLSAGIYFMFAKQLTTLLRGNIQPAIYYLAYPVIPLTLIWSHWAGNLMGLGLVKKVGLARVLNTATYLGASLLLVLFLSRHVRGALEAYILGQVVELGYVGLLLRRNVPVTLCWNREVMKEQLTFGAKNSLGGIFNYLNLRADAFFVNWFTGTQGLGIYTVAVGFAELILNPPHIIARVVLSFAAKSKDREGWHLAAHGSRLGLVVTGGAALFMAILMEPLIRTLFSARFIDATAPCLALLPGVIALGLATILSQGLMGYGKVFEWTKAVAFGFIATIILDIALIPGFGVLGASVASSIAYGIAGLYLVRVFTLSSGLSAGEILIPKRSELEAYAHDLAQYLRKAGASVYR